MSLSNENNPNEMRIPLGAISADTQFELKRLSKRIKLLDMKIIDPVGVGEDATNYVRIQLRRGAALVAEFSTETGNEGALAAGVWGEAPEKDVEIARDENLNLLVDVNGTGAMNAGSVAVVRYMEL